MTAAAAARFAAALQHLAPLVGVPSKRVSSLVARALCIPTREAYLYVAGARSPTIADCYLLARALNTDAGELAAIAGLDLPEQPSVIVDTGTLGEALLAWRAARVLPPHTAAALLQVSVPVLRRVEQGERLPLRFVDGVAARLEIDRAAVCAAARRSPEKLPAKAEVAVPAPPPRPPAPKPASKFGQLYPLPVETARGDRRALRCWRAAHHLDHSAAARKLRVDPETVARWESGSRPRSWHIDRLAQVLQCDPDTLAALYTAGGRLTIVAQRRSLARLRRDRGVKQSAVAPACGVEQTQFASWEADRVPLRHLPAIARALGTDPRVLYAAASRPDTSPPKPPRLLAGVYSTSLTRCSMWCRSAAHTDNRPNLRVRGC